MDKIIACIGSGNMGTALMKGAIAAVNSKNIFFTDADSEKANNAAKDIGGQVLSSNVIAAEKADCIFLGVKPQVLESVLKEITPALKERFDKKTAPVLVSMAAGWTIEKVQAVTGIKIPVARIMPNMPALISRGVIAMAFSPELEKDSAVLLETIMGNCGLVEMLEEKYFDAITALTGSGPAFVYLFIEALADGGVKAGLQRDKALSLAAQTVLGSAAMVLETGKHPGALKDMVTSPGGTTIAGITALEKNAFRGTVISAVEAAWQRAMELG